MSYGKDDEVNNDTHRKVRPEYPIEEPNNEYEDDPNDENPFETVGKKGGRCSFVFVGLILLGSSPVIGIVSGLL